MLPRDLRINSSNAGKIARLQAEGRRIKVIIVEG